MRFAKKLLGFGVAVAVGATMTLASAVTTTAEAAWEPKKPIEFIIMAGKGGGADKMARLMQAAIEKLKLSSKPLTPINKSGGSGAEALVHLNNASDPDHTIMVTLNTFYTTPMMQPKLGIDYKSFAPIARMAEDTFLLWVNKDSGITNLDEYLAKVKSEGNNWIMAGTGKGADNLITSFLNASYGLDIKYVPYKGGGKVAKQLAGNHANSTVNNPGEIEGFFNAGVAIPLAAFTAERLPAFPDAPTFKELGMDFEYYMQRSVVGAPGMSAEALTYYQNLFATLYETEEWQTYFSKKSFRGELLQGQALLDYWDVNNEIQRKLLVKNGLIK